MARLLLQVQQQQCDAWQASAKRESGAKYLRRNHIDALVAEDLPPDETLLLGDLLQLLGRDLARPVRLRGLLPANERTVSGARKGSLKRRMGNSHFPLGPDARVPKHCRCRHFLYGSGSSGWNGQSWICREATVGSAFAGTWGEEGRRERTAQDGRVRAMGCREGR